VRTRRHNARTPRWWGSSIALPLCLSGCLGWGSSSLPRALTDVERQAIDGVHLPLTVGVVPYVHPAYSDKLVEGLRDTELFDRGVAR
jgi:hypothetical protein